MFKLFNPKDAAGGVIVALLVLATFLAGLAAFVCIKVRNPDYASRSWVSVLLIESLLTMLVTLAMFVGSLAGALLFSRMPDTFDRFVDQTAPYAVVFFVEMLVAMLWVAFVSKRPKGSIVRRLPFRWGGIFVVFCLINVCSFHLFSSESAWDFVQRVALNPLRTTVDVLQYAWHSAQHAWFIVQSPIDYGVAVFKASGGNQFLIARDFPAWSIPLVLLAVVGSGIHALAQGTAMSE